MHTTPLGCFFNAHLELERKVKIIKTVEGIYAEAKIFTDDVEEYAEAQVKMICDNEGADGNMHLIVHTGSMHPDEEMADTSDEAPFSYRSIAEIAEQVNAVWAEHTRIVRGNPVRVYEGEKFILKKSKIPDDEKI